MSEQLNIMRLPHMGREYRAALKLGEQWFHQRSLVSFEDAERKIRADVSRTLGK